MIRTKVGSHGEQPQAVLRTRGLLRGSNRTSEEEQTQLQRSQMCFYFEELMIN